MAPASAAHRPGAWKQSNKGHKTGGHRSKGMVEKENRGRVEGGSPDYEGDTALVPPPSGTQRALGKHW